MLIDIYVDGRVRCRTSKENIEIAELYFRSNGCDTVKAVNALVRDDGDKQHTSYEWLAIVHHAKAKLDAELDFRGR